MTVTAVGTRMSIVHEGTASQKVLIDAGVAAQDFGARFSFQAA